VLFSRVGPLSIGDVDLAWAAAEAEQAWGLMRCAVSIDGPDDRRRRFTALRLMELDSTEDGPAVLSPGDRDLAWERGDR
jgi:hypothetical protein